MIIEGKNAVLEALKSEVTVEKVLIAKDLENVSPVVALAKQRKIPVQFLDKAGLDRASKTGKHQGVIALTTEFVYAEIEEIIAAKSPKLVLLLDAINDPHNLGAIIRAAECAGCNGIIIPKHRSVSVNDTVIRVSAGAAAHIKIAKATNLNDAIRLLKDEGFTVFAAETGGTDIYRTNLKGDIAIVIGSEGEGVHTLTKKLCDAVVSIPLLGKVNSLNASVAAGVVLFEAVRQRV